MAGEFKAEATLDNGMVAVLNMRSQYAFEKLTGGKKMLKEIDGIFEDVNYPSVELLVNLLHAFLLPNNPNVTQDDVLELLDEKKNKEIIGELLKIGFKNLYGIDMLEYEVDDEPETDAPVKKTRAPRKPTDTKKK